MIITSKKKCKIPIIFVHIPKTAGTSIKKYIGKNNLNDLVHMKLSEMKNYFYDKEKRYNKIKFRDYFKFTVLRNPWERMVSIYEYRKETSKKSYWQNIRKKNYNFNEFLKYFLDLFGLEELISRGNYLKYITLNKKIKVDYAINFHNFEKDFKVIKKIKIGKKNLIQKLRKSNKKDYRKYYNSESLDLINDIHKDDIEIFKFDFENTSFMDLSSIKNKCEASKKFFKT